MKILFIVQGEGRGHLTQAISMERCDNMKWKFYNFNGKTA